MPRILREPAAIEDLVEIGLYLRSRSPQAAEGFLLAAESDFNTLAEFPGLGAQRHLQNPRLAGLRSIPVSRYRNYLIFYLPLADGINVVRILHGAMRVESILERSR